MSGFKKFLVFFCLPASIVVLCLLGANVTMEQSLANHTAATKKSMETPPAPPVLTEMVTKGGMFACTTEEAFRQIVDASIKQDFLAIGYLTTMSGKCFVPMAGIPITVLQRRFLGGMQVRLYGLGTTATVWTHSTNMVETPVAKPAVTQSRPATKTTKSQKKGNRS